MDSTMEPVENKPEILIIGCGDIGRRAAKLALGQGAKVTALARTPEKAQSLENLGIEPVLGDLDGTGPIADLPTKEAVVFYFAPPPGGGEIDPRIRVFCGSVVPGEEPEKVILISTSGVYGDCRGAIVTEETPPNPQTPRARRRLDAETILRQWGAHRRVPVIILRVTGIYGPGRLPLNRLRDGHPVLREDEAPFTNRIHADDLARIALAAADKGEDGDVFNVSDGQSSTMTAYFNAVADAAGLPRPAQISLREARNVMNPLMLSYLTESRRMDNHKMLARLGVSLRYPDLAAGLRGSCKEG
jgi:nucleoside-diphosphate-sugar epimerase